MAVNVPVPLYGDVPPFALTVTLVVPPLHNILPCTDVALNALGSVMFTVANALQLLKSVTVIVYIPALKLFAVIPVPPPFDHEYVYGPVPPVTLALALPSLPPLQLTPLSADILTPSDVGCVMLTVAFATQLLASVAVIVYVPAVNPLAVMLVPLPPLHEYVYGDIPPLPPLAVALPLLPPHVTLTCDEIDMVNRTGCVTIIVVVAEQVFASVTV